MTRGKRSGYQETQADKRSEAGGAGTRTTTVQTRTNLRTMATRRSPQIAGEKMWKRSCRCTKSTTHVGRPNRGGKGVGGGGSGDRAQGSGAIPCVQRNIPQA